MIKRTLTALTRLALGLGCLSAAQASYLVNTNVGVAVANGNNSVNYGYNWNYAGLNGPTSGPVGSVSSINCSFPCTYTVSGTLEHTGTLTAANDQASIAAPGNIAGTIASASGTASADLSTGKIGVFATGTYLLYQGTQFGGETSSAGYLRDVLHFSLGGQSSAVIGITFSTNGTDLVGGGNTLVNPHLTFNDAQANANVGDNGTSAYIQSSGQSGWTTGSFTNLTPQTITFSGTYALTQNNLSIPILMSLIASCGAGDTCDYSHTTSISLSLPAGVSYTSDSGVFLTSNGVAATAPEPSSAALLGLGIVGVAWLRKRGGRSARCSRKS